MIKLLLWIFIIILITCYYKKSVKSKSHIKKFVYFDEEVDYSDAEVQRSNRHYVQGAYANQWDDVQAE